jgi:hypothetical protein
MTNFYEMRPVIVRQYVVRHDTSWRAMMQYVHKRDNLQRDLNKQYNFAELDGTYGAGKMSCTDAEYIRLYDKIEREFRELYNAEIANRDWVDSSTLSMFEYLLLDNASQRALKKMEELAEQHLQEPWYEFIGVKAHAEMEEWKNKYNVDGIMEAIRHELNDFRYRNMRCRKALSISRLNLRATFALFLFQRRYRSCIQYHFGRLEAA